MPKFDVSEFKKSLVAARKREGAKPPVKRPYGKGQPKPKSPGAIEKLVKPTLIKAGLDVAKLDQLIAEKQTKARKLFGVEKAKAAKAAAIEGKAFDHAITEGQKALEYLRRPDVGSVFGGLSRLVTLPKPFLIWEWPLDESLIDTHVEALKSSARIRLDVPAYAFDDDNGSLKREYSFYFFWSNDTPNLAVVKCFSVIKLTGACELWANAGIFSGDTMSLTIEADLFPVAFWQPLQPGNDIRSLRIRGDSLQHQVILNNLTAEGGHIFGSAGSATKTFSGRSFGMSFGSFGGVQIPGNATAVFEVTLSLSARWDGNSLPDEIIADFADEKLNHSVECPLVVLEFLTQPPVMAFA